MKTHELDPVSVTAYLRDLVRAYTNGVGHDNETQDKREAKAIDDCFQLFLGRSPTKDELQRFTPW